MNGQVTGHLKNWYEDPLFPVIWGEIQGDVHHRFYDGQLIRTSKIKERFYDEDGDLIKVRTLNSIYTLGEASGE